MSGVNAPWWRHDSNLELDLRFAKLRANLKADPYGLICRLYDFAAANQRDGQLAQVDDEVLAQRLGFQGKGKKLRAMLTAAGYLTPDGYVVDWTERTFRMYRAIQEQNADRGRKSAEARAQRKTKQDIDKERDITSAGARPVERPVDSHTPALWPVALSPEQQAAILDGYHDISAEKLNACYPAIRDELVRWKVPFGDVGFSEIRDKLRKSTGGGLRSPDAEHRQVSAKYVALLDGGIPEPEGWKAAIADDDELGRFASRDWYTIHRYYQERIVAAVERRKAASA